jgi:transcriptional regulator with XRE-family HTH domain
MSGMATGPGSRIKRARERRRWTQQELAYQLGVDRKTVDNWENGRTRPRSSAGAIEAVLGIRLDGADEAPPGTGPVIPADLERRLAQLTPEERAYVVGLLTGPREDGAPEDGDALREAR